MKALILAAGRGTRISRYLSGNPKCTVDIGDCKLIQYTVSMLRQRGVTEIALVLGYRQEVIREVLKDEPVTFFYNPFYDVTNSIASCWFARSFLEGDDLIIMNGDVFLEPSLIDQVLSGTSSPVLFADCRRKEDADYKFYYEGNLLKKYGKELSGADISGEYVGIARLSQSFLGAFRTRLEEMINTQQHSVWWENVLYSMVEQQPIYVEEVGNQFWAEVDYVEDYNRILAFRGCPSWPTQQM
jgi:choline kinase